MRAKSEFKVAGKRFSEYVGYRVYKDGIGFQPTKNWKDSATDCETYIKAPIVKDCVEFLVYCHELGHCKSKQSYEPLSAFGRAIGWGNKRLDNEYNAWVWGIRYFRRLGFLITQSHKNVIKMSLESYFKEAYDNKYAIKLSEKFKDWCGIETDVPVKEKLTVRLSPTGNFSTIDWFTFDELTDLKFPPLKWNPRVDFSDSIEEKKPAKWKPWMDLKNKQLKRSWKHQK